MLPINVLARLASRPQVVQRVSRSVSTSRTTFDCGCKQSREDCPPKKCESRVSKAKKKCKPMEISRDQFDGKDEKDQFDQLSSKAAIQEFSCKLEELQKNWEMMVAEMEKDCEAKGYKKIPSHGGHGGGSGEGKPKSHCKVKPPVKQKEEESKAGTYVGIALAAVLAAILVYYLYEEHKKAEGDGKDKKDEKKDEKKDGKKK